jgi:hypothetical protein
MLRLVSNLIRRLHHDERGNIAVLMLFAALMFVGLIGLVWNAGEYGTRRHHMQMAADSAANATEVWRARTVNLITASNMVIGENASAEILFRTVLATYNGVSGRLKAEQQSVANRLQQITTQLANNAKAAKPDPNLAFRLGLEQSALALVQQTLPLEQNEISDFHSITGSAFDFMAADDFAPRRQDIFTSYQTPAVAMLQQTVEQERSAIADTYHCDVTLATTGAGESPSSTSALITPPLKVVQYVNVDPIVDQGVDVFDGVKNVHVTGGNWGRIDDPPLNRYVTDRANRDANGQGQLLLTFLVQIDGERTALGQALQKLLTPPNNASANERALYLQVIQAVMGIGVQAPWYNPNQTFNGWGYHSPFARSTWFNSLTGNGQLVLNNMGNDPQFALVTYDRYDIPEWAKPQVYQSAYQNVYNQVYANNYVNILIQRFNQLVQENNAQKLGKTQGQMQQEATQYAQQITTQGAAWIAEDVANAWITQQWPYAPQSPTPMPPGIRTEDRLSFYTVVAGARSTNLTTPKPVFSIYFGNGGQTLVSYAQAETFNWMEYNGGYGASDVYTTWMPPPPWRVSTRGGMSWNPRLASADGLGAAMTNNAAFREYMDSAGVTNYDAPPLQVLNQH